MKGGFVFGLFLLSFILVGSFGIVGEENNYILEEGYGNLKITLQDTDIKENCNDIIYVEGIEKGCTSSIAIYEDVSRGTNMTVSIADFKGEASQLELLKGINTILNGGEFPFKGNPEYFSIGNEEEGFNDIISIEIDYAGEFGRNSEQLSLWISDNKFIFVITPSRYESRESWTLEEFLLYEYIKKYPSDLVYGYDSDLNLVLQTEECKYLNGFCVEKEDDGMETGDNEEEFNEGTNNDNKEEVDGEINTEDKTINLICNGCSLENTCVSVGYRKSNEYCSLDNNFASQLGDAEQCNNNFECESNVCVSGQCVESGLIQKILNWFRNLFGGE